MASAELRIINRRIKSVKSTKKTADVKKNVEKKVTPKKNTEKTSNKK